MTTHRTSTAPTSAYSNIDMSFERELRAAAGIGPADDTTLARDHGVAELVAHYRRLPETSPIHKFVEARLTTLLTDFPLDRRPELVILGRQGLGINACATSDGSIVISPEMLSFVKYVEELDFVLLHEATHLAHKHHKARGDAGISLVRAIGQGRISEYDADLESFTRLAHPSRNSSPMGAISILERLNELAPTAWDIEHGAIVDRIMNLKMFTLFRDLSSDGAVPGECGSLSKPLRSMPAFISEEVQHLPTGSRVQKLLERPPIERGYDEYKRNLLEAIDASETPSLRWTIPKLLTEYERQQETAKKLSSSIGAQWRLEAYRDVTRCALRKLSEHVATRAHDNQLSPGLESQLLGIELTLAGVTPEKVQSCLTGAIQKRCLAAFRNLSDNLTSAEAVERCSDLLSLIDGNASREHTTSLLFSVAQSALVSNCAFDRDDDSIDVDRYLAVVNTFADRLSDVTSPFGLDGSMLKNTCHAQGFLILASHLLDIESSQLDEALQRVTTNQSSFLSDAFAVNKALAETLAHTDDAELRAKIQVFSQSKFNLRSLETGQQELLAIFSKAKELVNKIMDPREADSALDSIQHLFQEAYQIAKFFPEEVRSSVLHHAASKRHPEQSLMSRKTLLENLYYAEIKDDHGVIESANFTYGARLMILKAGLFQALCSSTEDRDVVAAEIDDGIDLHTNRFEELVNLMNELRSERPESLIRGETLPRRSGNPHSELSLHESILGSLCHELLHSGPPPSAEEVLARLSAFVRMTAISKATSHDLNPPHLGLLALGEKALREVYPNDRSSEQFLKHALTVSFFHPHQSSARTIQREIILRLIDTMGAGRAARELFESLAPQRQWHNLETLEKLDETAVTLDEIRAVGSLCKQHLLEADRLTTTAGEAVVADMLLSQAVKWDSHDFLFTGIGTAENDAKLTDMIAHRWWIAHQDTLMNEIRSMRIPEGSGVELVRKELHDFLEKLPTTIPATFKEVGSSMFDQEFEIAPEKRVAQNVRTSLYGLGMGERLMTLRKLANDPIRGVLISPESRVQVANGLLDRMLNAGQEDKLTALSAQAFRALFRAVPADDLGLALTPMLLDHFLRAPHTSASWRPFAEARANEFLEEVDWPEKPSWTPYRKKTYVTFREQLQQAIADHIEWALVGRDPKAQQSVSHDTYSLMELCGINLADHKAMDRRGAIPFILDFSRNLQTPGTRALQLLGGIVELPPEIEREFLQVYDARKGQSKQSALNTIEKTLPEYALQLTSMNRIGGGALYSVFLANLKNGGREVIRVVNPNPEYHTQRILHSMRAAQAQLERENPDFAIGAQVIDLVDEWISNELRDATYESDDQAFRKSWNHWTPSRKCPLSIYIPESYPTNSLLVRREEFIPGRNFTELENIHREDPRLARNAVALAVQHYIAQVKSSLLNFGDAIVHSDISPGNIRLMDGGKVAILDRSMFLKFSLKDRLILQGIRSAKTIQEQATALVNGLSDLQDRKVPKMERAETIKRVTEALQSSSTVETTLLKGLLTAQKQGLKVPLRFQLLVKNLNALRVMAQKVGFTDLNDALTHDWT